MHPQCVEIRFRGTLDDFAVGFARLLAALDEAGPDAVTRYNAELAFEEIVANIVHHGSVDGRVPEVCVTLEFRPDAIVLTFDDDGVPFDPRGRPDPVPPKTLQQAKVGGFGLMLLRRAASSLDYVRTPGGHNRLTVRLLRAG